MDEVLSKFKTAGHGSEFYGWLPIIQVFNDHRFRAVIMQLLADFEESYSLEHCNCWRCLTNRDLNYRFFVFRRIPLFTKFVERIINLI